MVTSATFAPDRTAHCFVCGPENPLGLRLTFRPDGPFAAVATCIAQPEHAGWSGILHGGITVSLMDEAFGWCLLFEGITAVTASLNTRLHKPIPIGTPLYVRAAVTRDRRRLFDAHAEVRHTDLTGPLLAEADATLYRVGTLPGNPA